MTTVEREKFACLIGVAAAVAPKKAALPILGCVRLRVQNGLLTVEATDLETAVVGDVPCDGSDGDLGIVPARRLLSVLHGIDDARIGLTLADGRMKLTFESGGISLASFESADWPSRAAVEDGAVATVPGEVFARLGRVLYAAGTNPARINLFGVGVKAGKFVATDEHRLAEVAGLAEIGPLMVPPEAARVMAAEFASVSEVEIRVGKDAFSAKRPGLCVSTRIRQDLVSYERPRDEALAGVRLVVSREALLDALALLGSAGVEVIAFVPGDGKIRVEARRTDDIDGAVDVPIDDGKPPDVVVGLDRYYAEEAVRQMRGDTVAICWPSDPLRMPVAFVGSDEDVAVVMPVRL